MIGTDLVNGLKEFIEFLQDHPDFPMHSQRFCVYCCSKDEFIKFGKMLGGVKGTDQKYLSLTRMFGPVEIFLYTAHENICERVVSTQHVPEQVIPARAALVIPAHDEERVSWKCPESIFAPGRGLDGLLADIANPGPVCEALAANVTRGEPKARHASDCASHGYDTPDGIVYGSCDCCGQSEPKAMPILLSHGASQMDIRRAVEGACEMGEDDASMAQVAAALTEGASFLVMTNADFADEDDEDGEEVECRKCGEVEPCNDDGFCKCCVYYGETAREQTDEECAGGYQYGTR